METIWINIAADDGELVDRFAVWPDEQWSEYPDARVRLDNDRTEHTRPH